MRLFPTIKALIIILFISIQINVIAQTDNNSEYEKAIASGEKYIKEKEYINAKASFQYAAKLFPDKEYPKNKIAEVLELIKTQQLIRVEYNKALKIAKEYFNNKEYHNAIIEFNNALKVLPDETYPVNKIEEINKILEEEKSNDKAYQKAILDGNNYFKIGDFNNAIAEYEKANKLKPSEKFPSEKIDEIKLLISNNIKEQQAYDQAIEQGEKFFSIRRYSEAVDEFNKAAKIKPDDIILQKRIKETEALAIKQELYDKLIEEADNLYVAKKYKKAKEKYLEAENAFPEQTYPKEIISKIDQVLIKEGVENQNQYDELVAEGDIFQLDLDYLKAIEKFEKALEFKPEEQYPKDKITEINSILANQKSNQGNYEKAITAADNFFTQNDIENALAEYQNALNFKPEEQYPKDKITEINSILADQKTIQENYENAIAVADNFYTQNDLEIALIEYQNALNFKPEEQYPKDKITEINSILAEQKSTQENYEKAIATADNFLPQNDLENALIEYKNALSFKSEEQYPKDKITEINSILAEQKSTQENYEKAIVTADDFFTQYDLENALIEYQNALNFKSEEQYPKDKITEINSILVNQKSTQENYEKAIISADNFFTQKDFKNALTEYQNALNFKPEEQYPKDKITEINSILSEKKSSQENYEKAIAAADNFFTKNELENALSEYQNALNFKPEEQYPKGKITEINLILSDQKSTQENYEKAIVAADNFFTQNDLENALTEYQNALNFKSEEQYPKDKITEINSILADQKTIQENYEKAITAADNFITQNDIENALTEYQNALNFKSEEQYPKDKITEINLVLAEQKTTHENYEKSIVTADNFFTQNDLENALIEYQNALSFKSEEQYPKDKITKINAILADQKSTQENYEKAIVTADNFITKNELENALSEYQNALNFKPEEQYPKDKITEINLILSDQKSTQENYEKTITVADNFFTQKDFRNALTEYQNALNFKSEEQYPKDKITEINSIFAEQKSTQENYEKSITAADNFFTQNDFENALTEYQNALNLKSEEQYPKDKIIEINSILADQKSTQENYEKAIAAADNFFANNDLGNSLIEYQNAQNFKPEEQYPKDKITKINAILADQKSTQENYEKAITAADNFFTQNDLENALNEYQNALNFKSEEQYPKDRITEINSIIADQKTTQENYEKAIVKADNFFTQNDLENALSEYQNALNLKPEEQYPKDKISEINSVLVKQKIIEENYQKAIDQADKLFYSMNYANAIIEYQNALKIKPNDNYADDRIVESYAIIEQNEKEKKYNDLVSQADKYFDLKKYEDAKTEYKKAGNILPNKSYISPMIRKIEDIQLENRLLILKEYKNEIAKADHFFTSRIFDNAIESYKIAQKIDTQATYPTEMIEKITKIITDNAIVDVCNTDTEITNNSVKKFSFEPIFRKDRKNNYILLKAKNLGKSEFKIIMNYGRNESKNGGFVLKVPENDRFNNFIIRIGNQYNWFSIDNNWISIYPESGNLEVELIQISNGN